jgi:hypothetical protein
MSSPGAALRPSSPSAGEGPVVSPIVAPRKPAPLDTSASPRNQGARKAGSMLSFDSNLDSPASSKQGLRHTLSATAVAARRRVSNFALRSKVGSRGGGRGRQQRADGSQTAEADDLDEQADVMVDDPSGDKPRPRVFDKLSPAGFSGLKKMWANRESGAGFGNPMATWTRPYASVKGVPAMDISGPTNVVHTAHVVFDAKSLSYQGLPQEWQKEKDKGTYAQFGCSIQSCPRVYVEGYKERIPAVLVQLRDELAKHDGLLVEGVFRVAASFGDQKMYKLQVDTGTFQGCQNNDDVMCMAALIKEWFRTNPVRLLNALSLESLRKGQSDVRAELPEPNLSVFMWLCDLMAETVSHEDKNRMSVKAIAIVMAPNLYSAGDSASPNDVVLEMQGAVSIVEKALTALIQSRKLAAAAGGSARE